MTGNRSNGLGSALIPVGMLAVIAGCGGGAAMSGPGGAVRVLPPAGSGQMTQATISLRIPARSTSSKRRPNYVGPGTQSISVQVAPSGAPSPWPSPYATSVPTPAASPQNVTIPVTVPVGTDIFVVGAYDGPVVSGAATGYLVSGVTSSPVPISANGNNDVPLTLGVVASCALINRTGSTTTPFAYITPLQNQVQPQTETFTVTPCDVDGYPITSGPIGNTLVIEPRPTSTPCQTCDAGRNPQDARRGPMNAGPPPVPVFSPSVISSSGDTTVTMTYPAGQNAIYNEIVYPTTAITPAPGQVPPGANPFTVDPIYFLAVANKGGTSSSVSLFATDNISRFVVPAGTVSLPAGAQPTTIAGGSPLVNSCGGAGMIEVGNHAGQTVSILTEPSPGPGNPTPLPVATSYSPTGGASFQPVWTTPLDNNCSAFVVSDTSGYLASIPGNAPATANWNVTNGQPPSWPAYAVAAVGGNEYIGSGPQNCCGNYLSNIRSQSTADQSVGNTTYAMITYDASTIVIGYRPNNVGTFHIAQFAPALYPNPGYFVAGSDLDTGSAGQIVAMTLANGYVWAVNATGTVYQYSPTGFSGGTITPHVLANTGPTGITFNRGGSNIFVTNATTNTLDEYDLSFNLLTSLPTGNLPSAVTLAP